jgi:SAM-dependent methyltransferase
MKRKLEIVLTVVLVAAIAGFVVSTRTSPARGTETASQKAPRKVLPIQETTLRNVTDRTITYRIYPLAHPEEITTREIAPGVIDRFRTDGPLTVEFSTGAKDVAYLLEPGKPFSFRYDQGEDVDLFVGSHGRADAVDLAPYVPTPQAVVDRMLELAKLTSKEVLYDIGCGDGRIVITAAKKYGASGVGIDIDPRMVEASIRNARAAGVERLVKFLCLDATKADVSAATVVTLYLLPESNALLRPLLEKELRPGSRVVSHNYMMAGWEARQTEAVALKDETGTDHNIYVYVR